MVSTSIPCARRGTRISFLIDKSLSYRDSNQSWQPNLVIQGSWRWWTKVSTIVDIYSFRYTWIIPCISFQTLGLRRGLFRRLRICNLTTLLNTTVPLAIFPMHLLSESWRAVQEHNLSQSELERLISNSRQMKGHRKFWPTISMRFTEFQEPHHMSFYSSASTLPHRDFKSVNARVRRLYNPLSRQGQWTEAEDTKLLAWVCHSRSTSIYKYINIM